ncbi:hypothetical protein PYCC9005_005918 [Savitreella phatthalungensis]
MTTVTRRRAGTIGLVGAVPAVASTGNAGHSTINGKGQSPSSPPSTYPRLPSHMIARPWTPPAAETTSFPYTAADMKPMDSSSDAEFYKSPRFVTHIDHGAIEGLSNYYRCSLPARGVLLDLCSSWISHYPVEVVDRTRVRGGRDRPDLVILGTGMNGPELVKNRSLGAYTVQDLNVNPIVDLPTTDEHAEGTPILLDATTCAVSIDYLTRPVEVLSSIRTQTKRGGTVHLAISNRCFPTKVVRRWLEVDEKERLNMVGTYLWFSGWREIEVVDVRSAGDGQGGWGSLWNDPLWVVRGRNP